MGDVEGLYAALAYSDDVGALRNCGTACTTAQRAAPLAWAGTTVNRTIGWAGA